MDVAVGSCTVAAPEGAILGGVSYTTDLFFQSNVFLLALMILWTAVPVAIGYFLFERADLG